MKRGLKKTLIGFFRAVFYLLPPRLRGSLLRQTLRLEYIPHDGLIFKIADTKGELEQAFELLHNSYVSEGFMQKHPSGLRVTIYHALPTTTILVAVQGKLVVGTISLIRDGAFGLPINAAFDLSKLKKNGHQIVEVSSLAVHKDFRGHQGILFLLCKFALEYCIKYIETDYMVIAVNPRDTELYESIMLFEPLQRHVVESYEFANGAPAVGKYLDLKQYHNKLLEIYWSKPAIKNLFAFYMQAHNPPQFRFPERSFYKTADPVMTPELFDYFMNLRTSTLEKLTESQLEKLQIVYAQSPQHLDKFPEPGRRIRESRRIQSRYRVKCEGTITNQNTGKIGQLKVIDVSDEGFMAVSDEIVLAFNQVGKLRLVIGAQDVTELEVELKWMNDEQVGGYYILNCDSKWETLINHLKQDLRKSPVIGLTLVSKVERRIRKVAE